MIRMSPKMKKITPLTPKNILRAISAYEAEIEHLKLGDMVGYELVRRVKRDQFGQGPYPNVTFFESANLIMTDLVILYGIKELIDSKSYPDIVHYHVEYGNENNRPHDIMGVDAQENLVFIAEAFNVSQKYFSTKRRQAENKLQNTKEPAKYRAIIYNEDANLNTVHVNENIRHIVVNLNDRKST